MFQDVSRFIIPFEWNEWKAIESWMDGVLPGFKPHFQTCIWQQGIHYKVLNVDTVAARLEGRNCAGSSSCAETCISHVNTALSGFAKFFLLWRWLLKSGCYRQYNILYSPRNLAKIVGDILKSCFFTRPECGLPPWWRWPKVPWIRISPSCCKSTGRKRISTQMFYIEFFIVATACG